jgi:peptide/nickel transport system permease protein
MILGFVSAYSGGWLDGVIKTFVDILLTVPQLLVLVLIAVSIPRGGLTVDQMALAVAVLAWRWPARTVRSQVLVMREAPYVQIAKLSGTSDIGIIFKEMMPNLAPYVFASFVSAVAAGILASIGLEALGLGPLDSPTLGMTIYWNIWYSSILHGWWWWLLPPIIVIILLFVGLFMITAGLDEVANPRLRRRV